MPGAFQPHLAVLCANLNSVYAEVHQVTASVRDIGSAVPNRVEPFGVGKGAVDFGVTSALAYATVVNTREIGLTGDPRAETDVKRVIPNIQLPDIRRVAGRDEINCSGLGYVGDILVCPNAIEGRHLERRQFLPAYLETPS